MILCLLVFAVSPHSTMCKGCHHPPLVSVIPGLSLEYRGGQFPNKLRSVEPDIFTFDPIVRVKRPTPTNPRVPGKRRTVKVLYPAQVRMYLPPKKKDWVKRVYLLFLSIVVVQVYAATEGNEEIVKAAALPMVAGDRIPLLPTNGSAIPLPILPMMRASSSSTAVGSPCGRIVKCIGKISRGNQSSPQQDTARELPHQLRVTLDLCGVKSGNAPSPRLHVQ